MDDKEIQDIMNDVNNFKQHNYMTFKEARKTYKKKEKKERF